MLQREHPNVPHSTQIISGMARVSSVLDASIRAEQSSEV